MCRMVGVVFRSEFPVESLRALREVAGTGKVPEEEELGHRDGWGMVSFSKGSPNLIGKSERPAHLDPSYDSATLSASKVQPPNILVAHVRAASAGSASLKNTHPFITGGLVLAHNGTVKGRIPQGSQAAKGDTDSERLSLLLADRYAVTKDLVRSVTELVRDDLKDNTYRGTVLLVSDGSRLVGFRKVNYQDWEWYYKLKLAVRQTEVMLFQEVPTGCNVDGQVSEVGDGELVAIDSDLSVARMQVL